ncbi:MAG: nuclear transport factor 2 family protein [Arenibacter latericius]|nr:nuclear transport factor 2 family protein [Arenibacter latericius]
MKTKITLLALALLSITIAFGQKKTNGNVYIEHPAIDVVDEFVKASVAGDSLKMASYITEDFKAYWGTTNVPDTKGLDKAAFIRNQLLYFNALDYYSVTPFPGSYPDAIEYKKDNKDEEVWVQTWVELNGVHKRTGVKIDASAHRLYKLTKDNKINTIINYANGTVLDEIRASFVDRKNGTIYNHHDNINTIRKMVYAMEKGDMEKAYSFYAEDATFGDLSSFKNRGISLADQKVQDKAFLEKFDLVTIEMSGYPDYLEYEMDDSRAVLSWWNFHLVRKSDKMAIVLPVFFIDDFNKDGKIIRESAYYNERLLEQPFKVASN